jgi:acetate kinase
MNILVFNVGSATLKYALFDTNTWDRVQSDTIDYASSGTEGSGYVLAIRTLLQQLKEIRVDAIGHRVVQGGELFRSVTQVDQDALATLKTLDPLAPLHNPPARNAILAVVAFLEQAQTRIPQFMVFDTAYYSALPEVSFRYAIPETWYREYGVRRYGAHGTSHQYLVKRAGQYLSSRWSQDATKLRIVSLHLGGGSSATASRGGRPIETSMGFTPLEGLVMGTRSGDIDPSVVFHMMRQASLNADAVEFCLNKESGLKGLCGESDMRRILGRVKDGDPSALLAVEIYTRRVQKMIGAYAALLGGIDAVVFGGGIGENNAEIRRRSMEPLRFLGLQLSPNEVPCDFVDGIADVTELPDPAPKILVIKTDEERSIAEQIAPLVVG